MAALSIVVTIGVGGCGAGGSSSSGSTTTEVAGPGPRAPDEGVAKPASKGGAKAHFKQAKTPQGRRLQRSFPPPQTKGLKPQAMNAVEMGEAACAGKTPTEVKEEFLAEAEEVLDPGQLELVGEIGKFEAKGAADQAFVAGQLAADTYEATLPEETERAGYQGCIYALAQTLATKKK